MFLFFFKIDKQFLALISFVLWVIITIVAFLSFIIGLIYEEFILENILKEIDSILYAGILSGGFAFVLQIYAQKNITPAPAAKTPSKEKIIAAGAGVIFFCA